MNEELNDVIASLDDDVILQEAEEAEAESEYQLSETGADSETETEENSESVEEQPAPKHNKLQARLDKLSAEKYAEKRRADELAARLAALEAQKPVETQADLVEPSLPDDIFDVEAMQQYHKDMASYARKVAAHEAKTAYSSLSEQQQQAQKQIEQQKTVQSFAKRAIDGGYSIEQIEQAGTALVNAGLNQDLQMLLLEDEAGPQMTMYLAKNPELALELVSQSTAKAAVMLATKVKAAAVSAKPKVSKAPDPIPQSRTASIKDSDELDRYFSNSKFI